MKIEKLEIEIQKDLNKFKEEIFFGLSFKQFTHVIAGGVLAVILYGFFSLIGIPFIKEILIVLLVTPVFVAGFFEYQGLNLKEFAQNVLEFYTRDRVILYADYSLDELLEMERGNEKEE